MQIVPPRAYASYLSLINTCASLHSSIQALRPISIRKFLCDWAPVFYSEHAQFINCIIINKRSGRFDSRTYFNFRKSVKWKDGYNLILLLMKTVIFIPLPYWGYQRKCLLGVIWNYVKKNCSCTVAASEGP